MPHIHITKISRDGATSATLAQARTGFLVAAVAFFAFSASVGVVAVQAFQAHPVVAAKRMAL